MSVVLTHPLVLHSHAGGYAKGGGNGGEHGDDDVQDFLPKRFVHDD